MVGNVNVTAEKVIFLDIDGVLNDEGDRLKKGVYIEDEMVARLKKIVEATGAQIVLSSSWRKAYFDYLENLENGVENNQAELNMLHDILKRYDLSISGRTDYISSGPYARPAEIRAWLATANDVKSFIILDDDDFWAWNWLSDRFVMTKKRGENGTWIRGLDDEHIVRAVDILNRKNQIPKHETMPW